MSKSTKKRTMIYSNVKENKKRAEEISRIKDEQINLNEEVFIGLSNNFTNDNNGEFSTRKKTTNKNNVKRRHNKVNRTFPVLKGLIIVGILIAVMIALVNTSLFDIKEVSVSIENNSILTDEQIKELAQINVGENLFFINKHRSIDYIKSNPYVESVKIKRAFPNKIKIEIVERSIRFQLEHEGSYINIDGQGYILEEAEERENVVLIEGYSTEELSYGDRLNLEDLQRLSDVIQIIQEAKNNNLEEQITKIDIEDNQDYKIYFENDGKIAYIGDVNSINDKLSYVKKILEMESEYEGEIFVNVDFNNGEYPYFREKV